VVVAKVSKDVSSDRGDKKLRLADVKRMFLQMRDHARRALQSTSASGFPRLPVRCPKGQLACQHHQVFSHHMMDRWDRLLEAGGVIVTLTAIALVIYFAVSM
jgi:hypothetical protein